MSLCFQCGSEVAEDEGMRVEWNGDRLTDLHLLAACPDAENERVCNFDCYYELCKRFGIKDQALEARRAVDDFTAAFKEAFRPVVVAIKGALIAARIIDEDESGTGPRATR